MSKREFIVDLPIYTYVTVAVEAENEEEALAAAVDEYFELKQNGDVMTAEWLIDEYRAASVDDPEARTGAFVNTETGKIIGA